MFIVYQLTDKKYKKFLNLACFDHLFLNIWRVYGTDWINEEGVEQLPLMFVLINLSYKMVNKEEAVKCYENNSTAQRIPYNG